MVRVCFALLDKYKGTEDKRSLSKNTTDIKVRPLMTRELLAPVSPGAVLTLRPLPPHAGAVTECCQHTALLGRQPTDMWGQRGGAVAH